MAKRRKPYFDALMTEVRARQPHFATAVVRDAKLCAMARGERYRFRGRLDAVCQVLRLMWTADAFFAMVMYRAQASLDARKVPVLPRLAHHLAVITGQICIGRTVVIQPGVYIAHGQVTIDGFVVIESDVVISPSVSIGLRNGVPRGPVLERGVRVGTGARVLGDFTVHHDATIGANAVVTKEVPANSTVIGVPARVVTSSELHSF